MTDATPEHNPPQPLASLILLHGLGATSQDLYPLAPNLHNGQLRVICPQAPSQPITINNGFVMPAWYDITGADLASRQDEEGIKTSAAIINDYLDAEIKNGAPASQILLGGFSQGAAMALYAGLRYPRRLAGIIALSGYMLLDSDIDKQAAAVNRAIPIFQGHGIYDPVVLPTWGQQCNDLLTTHGWAVTYREYPMAHAIIPQEIADINLWLNKILKPV